MDGILQYSYVEYGLLYYACGDMQGLDASVLTHSVDVKHTLEQLNRESQRKSTPPTVEQGG